MIQAGGASGLEKAVVWWFSVPFAERIHHPYFIENRDFIESRWYKQWGDPMKELAFIGQNIDQEEMMADLEKCLLSDEKPN